VTPRDFATDPDIGAELDRQARRIREERRVRAEAPGRRAPIREDARPIAQLLPRLRGRP